MKKIIITLAALVAFFMLPAINMTAYALADDESYVVADDLPDEYTEAPPTVSERPEAPFSPPGTGTVVDDATDADGKYFFTIMTPDEHIFYLIIDKQRGSENVYFLNAVTVADLLPLAQMPAPPQNGMIVTPPEPITDVEEPEIMPEPEPEQSGGNTGVYIFILLVAVAGGGAGWYFKIYRPKQEQLINDNEFEPELNQSDDDYSDDWGNDVDNDIIESDDAPPWDEDEQ